MKLQILVPQYLETENVIRPLLDSIEIQQNVDLVNDVGVIIVNDGSDVQLSDEFLSRYSFPITYILKRHGGVSAARNKALDEATATYVMFCDADDMFYNACGLYILFREINDTPFDALVSVFIEETRINDRKEIAYVNHSIDQTFVHGKVYRLEYLRDNNIRWNDDLTIHEDSYFNCLAIKSTETVKFCPTPFYLWRWRDDSVCRHDPKYILKTYNNMLDSNTALVHAFADRGKVKIAKSHVAQMVYDAYFTMNKKEWLDQENQEYRKNTERRFKRYYDEFKDYFDTIEDSERTQIIIGIKNRMFAEGLLMESITFDDWILKINKDYSKEVGGDSC